MAKLLLTASVAIFLATLVLCNASNAAEGTACCCNNGGGGPDLSVLTGLIGTVLALVLSVVLGLLCLLCCLGGNVLEGCSGGDCTGLISRIFSSGEALNIEGIFDQLFSGPN